MAGYVKIKRSKNLRFKLISLMYLIFLVLAVIQIPIGWMKVTPFIRTYITKPRVAFKDSVLYDFTKKIQLVQDDFLLSLGEDYANLSQENSYALTDVFFLEGKGGKQVFASLIDLQHWANQLPGSDPRKALFVSLFKEDMENGLAKENETRWLYYKWKHVPASLARGMLEEFKLRAKLLNKGKLEEIEEGQEPSFTLMTQYATMRVGDEATLAAKGDSLLNLLITRDSKPVKDYVLNGNSFVFKPTYAGKHVISVQGKTKNENMVVQVLPAGFPTREALPFRICYKGISYDQSIPFHYPNLQLFCESDSKASIEPLSGKIKFCPNKEGWCTLRVNSGEGLLFLDSVFVKPLPDPLFQIQGLPGLKISRKRLSQQGGVLLEAVHPSFKEKAFEIQSFQVRKAGYQPKVETISGDRLTIPANEINLHTYLILYDIEVKMGLETKKFDQAIVIQII